MRLIDADAMRENLIWCKEQSGNYDDHWDDVIERLDAQPTVGGWISVTDRLPEEREEKYFLVKKSNGFMSVEFFQHKGNRSHWGKGRCLITHWMPLPEPPKEDSND